jgi:hypothetical protein
MTYKNERAILINWTRGDLNQQSGEQEDKTKQAWLLDNGQKREEK